MVQTVQGLKNMETVVVPTSEETSLSQSPTGDTPTSVSLEKFSTTAAASAPQDVDATQFYSGLLTICNRFDIRCGLHICMYFLNICIYFLNICIYSLNICIYSLNICIYSLNICMYSLHIAYILYLFLCFLKLLH